MEVIKKMAQDLAKEAGNRSREFFEFVLPPMDMIIEDNFLVAVIDMPGFEKKDIKLSIHKNLLSISAHKSDMKKEEYIFKQRPHSIDKKIMLPVHIEEEAQISAKFVSGVLTVKIPFIKKDKPISIE
jgi:HSP20 family molecular chaperone IbpA